MEIGEYSMRFGKFRQHLYPQPVYNGGNRTEKPAEENEV